MVITTDSGVTFGLAQNNTATSTVASREAFAELQASMTPRTSPTSSSSTNRRIGRQLGHDPHSCLESARRARGGPRTEEARQDAGRPSVVGPRLAARFRRDHQLISGGGGIPLGLDQHADHVLAGTARERARERDPLLDRIPYTQRDCCGSRARHRPWHARHRGGGPASNGELVLELPLAGLAPLVAMRLATTGVARELPAPPARHRVVVEELGVRRRSRRSARAQPERLAGRPLGRASGRADRHAVLARRAAGRTRRGIAGCTRATQCLRVGEALMADRRAHGAIQTPPGLPRLGRHRFHRVRSDRR
jgi:hypothetical protein